MSQINTTVSAYDKHAKEFAALHHLRVPLTARKYAQSLFISHGRTLDLGCGSGRDSAWLSEQGYIVTAIDPSSGMIKEARERYENVLNKIVFRIDSLPELRHTSDESFENIFCNAVLMHIPNEELRQTAENIAKKLVANGIIIVSYKANGQEIDTYGRKSFSRKLGYILSMFSVYGLHLVHQSKEHDDQDSSVIWHVLAFRKGSSSQAEGLKTIASILENDAKTTTYKYALIRALCSISKDSGTDSEWVDDEEVSIRLERLTREWIRQYWPIVKHDRYISQGKDDVPTKKQITIRTALNSITSSNDAVDLYPFLNELDRHPETYRKILKKISESIIEGPIKHSGGAGAGGKEGNKVFRYDRQSNTMRLDGQLWRDIESYAHWIEDSVVIRWAKLTVDVNPQSPSRNDAIEQGSSSSKVALSLGSIIDLLSQSETPERSTKIIHDLLGKHPRLWRCVWTGKPLEGVIHVDHCIPFSVWQNNDLFNLFPTKSEINLRKSDKMPGKEIILRQQEIIHEYWSFYHGEYPEMFKQQIHRALGVDVTDTGEWLVRATNSLIEKSEIFRLRQGLTLWNQM